MTGAEMEGLEALIEMVVDQIVRPWTKRFKGTAIGEENATQLLKVEIVKALVAVAAGSALAFTGLAVEAAAEQTGQKVQ